MDRFAVEKNDLLRRLRTSHNYFGILGDFKTLVVNTVERNFSVQMRDEVEENWKKLLEKSKGNLWSGGIVACYPQKTFLNKSELHISIYPTEYKFYISSLNLPARVWTLGVSGIVGLKEGNKKYYIFGERNDKTMDAGGKIETLPAGFVMPEHLKAEKPFEKTLLQELVEEVGITNKNINNLKPFLIGNIRTDKLSDRLYQDTCLVYTLSIEGLSRKNVSDIFDSSEREHTKIEFVDSNELINYLNSNFNNLSVRTRFCLEYFIGNGE